MSAFNPARTVTEYGQLDTLLGVGAGHADELFLNMLDQYDQVTGSDGYFDHDGMVDELLDALNRRLNPIGLDATRSGVVYCNVMGAPDLHEVDGALDAFMEQDWDRIIQNHDASNRPELVTGEFVNPDHAAREVAARSVHQHPVDVEVSAFVTGEYAYRLSYDEVTNGLSEEENPYTGLPEAAHTGEGFHTMVRLERFDPESWEWDEIDSESVDGPDAEASAPYDDAERRIIARNGLEDRRIEVVAPWGSHTIEPEPSPAVSEKSVSLNAEAKTMRDASQALDGHDAAANERPLDR